MKPNKENIVNEILIELEKGRFNKTIPDSGYYVYIIFNKTFNKIIYIGKGKNKRVLFHFKNKEIYLNTEIYELKQKGYEIEYSIISNFNCEKEAYKYESFLIKECLKFEIEIYNIAQTHKDIFIKNNLIECIKLLNKFLSKGFVNQTNSKILSIQEATNIILKIVKKQLKNTPILSEKYKLKGINIGNIKSIELGSNNNIIYVNKLN